MLRIAADPILLWQNLAPTFIESILGFVIGNLAAILLAIAFVYNRRVEQAYFPSCSSSTRFRFSPSRRSSS